MRNHQTDVMQSKHRHGRTPGRPRNSSGDEGHSSRIHRPEHHDEKRKSSQPRRPQQATNRSIGNKNLETKKKKKPKHLKRKLEALEGNDTTEAIETRQQLAAQLTQWQHDKEVYLQKKKLKLQQQENEEKDRRRSEDAKNGEWQQPEMPRGRKQNTFSAHPSNRKVVRGDGAADNKRSRVANPKDDLDSNRKSVTTKDSETVSNQQVVLSKAATPNDKHREAKGDVSSDSDDNDSVDEVKPTKRERGQRRRRGRKANETTSEPEPTPEPTEQVDFVDCTGSNIAADAKKDTSKSRKSKQDPNVAIPTTLVSPKDTESKQRYCIGRKPVTDFVVGQSYEGKVVYIKPFGVFFDIGCHSDAFCHVSRLADDFVEHPESQFAIGDIVSARIVEIDRSKKRITVSLQSNAKLADEQASIQARLDRKRKAPTDPPAQQIPSHPKHPLVESAHGQGVQTPQVIPLARPALPKLDESQMTSHQELKRSRKLERRAARRAARDVAQ